MTQPPADMPHDMPQVACAVCRREIPRSVAQSAEGRDYTLYFCSLGCRESWEQQEGGGRDERPPSG